MRCLSTTPHLNRLLPVILLFLLVCHLLHDLQTFQLFWIAMIKMHLKTLQWTTMLNNSKIISQLKPVSFFSLKIFLQNLLTVITLADEMAVAEIAVIGCTVISTATTVVPVHQSPKTNEWRSQYQCTVRSKAFTYKCNLTVHHISHCPFFLTIFFQQYQLIVKLCSV